MGRKTSSTLCLSVSWMARAPSTWMIISTAYGEGGAVEWISRKGPPPAAGPRPPPGAARSCRPPVSICSGPKRHVQGKASPDLPGQRYQVHGHEMGITIVVEEGENVLLFGCCHPCSFGFHNAISVPLRNEYIRSSIMSCTP